MRDISAQPNRVSFGIHHAFWLSSRDIRFALDDALSEYRAVLGHSANLGWETVSLKELISFHRQLFLWRLLMLKPQVVLGVLNDWSEEQGEPPT